MTNTPQLTDEELLVLDTAAISGQPLRDLASRAVAELRMRRKADVQRPYILLTDEELAGMFGAHCECRPIDILREYHSHDCDTGEVGLRAAIEIVTLRAINNAKQRGYDELHAMLDPVVGREDVWTQVDALIKRVAALRAEDDPSGHKASKWHVRGRWNETKRAYMCPNCDQPFDTEETNADRNSPKSK